MRALRRLRQDRRDGGFTLVELLVSMTILAVVLGIVTAAIVSMFQTVRKQQNEAVAIDNNRRAVEVLDKQVRFANAIRTPGAGTPAGSWYVEWRTGNTGQTPQPQTCTQWRFLPTTGQLQARTWTEGSYPATLSTWTNMATNVSTTSGLSVFAFPPPNVATTLQRQQLVVAFTTSVGNQQRTSRATVLTLTAQNTPSSGVPANACTDGGINERS